MGFRLPGSIENRFKIDLLFVDALVRNETPAWQRFYTEVRPGILHYIENRYHGLFSLSEVEELCDGIQDKLTRNDSQYLRRYRGGCTFQHYLLTLVRWHVVDTLRRRADHQFVPQAVLETPVGTHGTGVVHPHADSRPHSPFEMDSALAKLDDDERWAFLLRYHFYLDFPPREIRKVAARKRWSISDTAARIASVQSAAMEAEIVEQVEKRNRLIENLEKVFSEIMRMERMAPENPIGAPPEQEGRRAFLLKKRKRLLDGLHSDSMILKTPYKVIAEILDEPNTSTIRHRVMRAREQLKKHWKRN